MKSLVFGTAHALTFPPQYIFSHFPYLCPHKFSEMSKSLIPKLEAIKQRYNEVADLIIQPDVISDQMKYSALNKEYSDLGKIVTVYDKYKHAITTIDNTDLTATT